MRYFAEIIIMPKKELLDPQGNTVKNNLHLLQIDSVIEVRIGKCIHMQLEANDRDEATHIVEKACSELLANPIIEEYTYRLRELSNSEQCSS